MIRFWGLVFCFLSVLAADLRGQLFSHHEVRGVVIDSLTSEPMAGAYVSIINRAGSFHLPTDKEGKFRFMLVRDGDQVKIEVTYLGYRIARRVLDAERRVLDAGRIQMSADPTEIDAVVVKARRLLFQQRGDTIVYFPSSLYLREGATALDALKKMPGVEAGAEGVTVLGQNVERTYVNGKLVFGKDDPLHALNNLEAKDVSAILAYDEYDEVDALRHGEHGRKRKVLNVLTFELFDQSINASLMASWGKDTEKGMDGKYKDRYLLGAGFNFFSERRHLVLDYVGNNTMNFNHAVYSDGMWHAMSSNNPYQRTDKAVVEYADKIANKWDVSGTYSYDYDYTRRLRVTRSDYFATEEAAARVYADTSRGRSFSRVHTGTFKLENITNTTYTEINAEARFPERQVRDFSSTLLTVSGNPLSHTSVGSDANGSGNGFKLDGRFLVYTKKGSVDINALASFGRQDRDDVSREDSVGRLQNKLISVTGAERQRNLKGTVSYSIGLEKGGSFTLGYGAEYRYNREHLLALDQYTGAVDSALTRKYTDDYFIHSGSAGYSLRLSKFHLMADVRFENKTFNRDERFFEPAWKEKTFNALLPTVRMGYQFDSQANALSLDYETSTISPSLEMLAGRLDYVNPMFLSAGNRNLKQGYSHDIRLGYQLIKQETQSNFFINLAVSFRNNILGNRSRYFPKEEYLPQYSYMANEGAVLTTYENLNGAFRFNVNGDYSFPVRALGCRASAGVLYDYDKLPMFVGERRVERIQHAPQLRTGLSSDFSEVFECKADYTLEYSNSTVAGGESYISLVNKLKASLSAEFLKRMYLTATYEFYRDYSYTLSGMQVSNHLLNATIGCRMFKNRRGDLSFTVYDLLNRNRGFERTVYADRVTGTWQYRTPRFALLSFTYRFKRNK